MFGFGKRRYRGAPGPEYLLPTPRKKRSGSEEIFLQYLEQLCRGPLPESDAEIALMLAREVSRSGG